MVFPNGAMDCSRSYQPWDVFFEHVEVQFLLLSFLVDLATKNTNGDVCMVKDTPIELTFDLDLFVAILTFQ